jgi:hypothetical protein
MYSKAMCKQNVQVFLRLAQRAKLKPNGRPNFLLEMAAMWMVEFHHGIA